MAKEKLYWKIEHRGDGWNDWWDCTCPACGKTLEKHGPYRFCPNCGKEMAGGKDWNDTWEFDANGRLNRVNRRGG